MTMNMMTAKEVGFADLLKNGQTLKEFRDGILERTEKTGHYNGLTRLELRERDPIRYEKLFSKLRGGLVHARETAKKIAASPIVEQEGELCFTLYNAAGDCVLTSTGIIIHVGTMGAAIKYMIENAWEVNPGINPGDMFTNNDCSIGNVHPCDIATIVPIFWEGKLVGWVGGVTHVIDLGAMTPGSMSTGQASRFGDGLQARVKAMTVPGVYRRVAFVDIPYDHEDMCLASEFGKMNSIMHAPCEMTIRPDATWRLNFEGASRWGWHSFNANQVAFTSGI